MLKIILVQGFGLIRESSFNMTRADEDIEGGPRKFSDTQKGGSENLYTSKQTGGGGGLLKN